MRLMLQKLRRDIMSLSLERKAILTGWSSVLLSAILLYLSVINDLSVGAYYLVLARIFGISGFVCGAVSIFHHRWTHGSLLLILSLGLPFVAILFHGTV